MTFGTPEEVEPKILAAAGSILEMVRLTTAESGETIALNPAHKALKCLEPAAATERSLIGPDLRMSRLAGGRHHDRPWVLVGRVGQASLGQRALAAQAAEPAAGTRRQWSRDEAKRPGR
jgi:hypothetical protein